MSLAETFRFLIEQPLLAIAVAAILLVTLGGMMRRGAPRLGGFIRGLGNLGLVAALLLTIVQVARFTSGNDLALPQLGRELDQVAAHDDVLRLADVEARVGGAAYDRVLDQDVLALHRVEPVRAVVRIGPARPFGADAADQKRIMTPAEAVSLGATHLVIGRPITQAADPVKAARDILDSIAVWN